ncbi:helix-turn-helix transcriptional regulator [Candidatus Woesearchaeota archaeon]|nr:helix-turn-helix transcriptional regulator [Candidatus Woesearchaeota archaeon]
MELETLFTSSKWEIMKRISQEKESPLQIAQHLNTTIANISQQLRLLEMAGLIKKERLSNRASGKPRMLFSLKEDFAYLITCTKEGVNKKLIPLDLYQKIILNIFITQNSELEKIASEFYLEFEKSLNDVKAILFNAQNKKELYVLSEKPKDVQRNFEKITRKVDSSSLDMKFLNDKEFLKAMKTRFQISSKEDIIPIYDSEGIIANINSREVEKNE